ncbi:MAG: ferrochelatase [Planctomycetes bacterium]|nr:ferrochelatase [Planctomycetota bacterium]
MAERSPVAPRGVLLSNLGTPASPSTADVQRFLDEFLSDPKVVRAPRWFWLPLLRRVILPRRAPRSAHAYAKVWSDRGSPLLAWSIEQRAAMQAELGDGYRVALGMRYGEPSLERGCAELEAQGVRELLLLPLYPQYSDTTNGTTIERVRELEAAGRVRVPWRAAPSFPDERGYIDALAVRTREHVRGPVDHHVFSFHGLPERYVRRGDPYASECERTAAALARALDLGTERWTLAYQSKFGPGKWLGPATKDVLAEHARRGERVAVVLPGFAADCLETLEEIAIGLAEEFRAAGGRELVVVPALNAHPSWIRALATIVRASGGA